MSLHYESAEGQIVQARETHGTNPAGAAFALAVGQIHATLALVDAVERMEERLAALAEAAPSIAESASRISQTLDSHAQFQRYGEARTW